MTTARGRLLAPILALVIALGWLVVAAPTARADSEDTFDRFDVVAQVDSDGFLQVRETIVLRFGAGSGRHGLERTLTTREPDPDTGKDMLFVVDQVTVSSPSGAPTQLDLTTLGIDTRSQALRIRVGDPNRTVSTPTATYVLSYRVAGLLRSPGGVDQLYWDATGAAMPTIVASTVSVTVPGGAQGVFCSVAAPGQKGACVTSVIGADKVAHFAAADIARGQVLTVGVKISPGLVKNNTPILEDDIERVLAEQLDAAGAFGFFSLVLSSVAAIAVPFIGRRRVRRETQDLRFVGLPPGVLPAKDTELEERRGDPNLEIPVAFAPPSVGYAEAGYLLDGKVEVRDSTATLVGLAVAGAVQLRLAGVTTVTLIDREQAAGAVPKAMLKKLFDPKLYKDGQARDISGAGTMAAAHTAVVTAVNTAAVAGRWYARPPRPALDSIGCDWLIKAFLGVLGAVVVGVVAVVFFGPLGVGVVLTVLGASPLLITMAVTWIVVRTRIAKGQRSGIGTALRDQVVGFRTYLATADTC